MPDISYKIIGSDLQYVEVTLPPQATVIGEQGAMMFVDDQVNVTTILGDGSASSFGAVGRFFKAFKRMFTGESMFSSCYTNTSDSDKRVAFATSSISKILPVKLEDMGGSIICQKGAYLAGEPGITINIAFQKRLRVGFFGGEGFIMQRISGNGIVFINANGALTEITLQPGQSLRVDSGCLVALTPSTTYEIKYAGKVKNALFGGEGLFYANLKGPGKVWIQSLPERRLGAEMMKAAVRSRMQGPGGKLYLLMIVIVVIASVFTKH
jgi:uncharacterized protein (TIGR00266 family)